MFSIDFPEIIIIFGVALVVLGPKKLPGAAAKIGRWVGRARSMARQFREQLEQEVSSAENAIDIRKSFDSPAEPARRDAARSGATAAETGDTPREAAPPESVPHEAVAHGTSAPDAPHEPHSHDENPHEPMPYESSPYESVPYGPAPPPEGYEPAPEQLTFDAQLHDTALPPEDSSHVRDWMPETQTWMSSAGWETPESEAEEAAGSRAGAAPEPAAPHTPHASHASQASHGPPDAASTAPKTPSRTEAVEHDDR